MAPAPGNGPDKDGRDEIVEFGSGRSAARRPLPRWVPRALLACLVVAAVVTVAVRGVSHQARPAAKAPAPPPPMRVTLAGHRLLGVTAGWELFARGPNELLRIQLAQGRITQTYVPPLETASPDVAFVIGAHEAVIRPSDLVPGYVVPDGGQARPLTGVLSDGGPLVPGPVRLTGGLGCLGLAHLSGAVADHAHRAPVRTEHPVPVWRAAGAWRRLFPMAAGTCW